MLGLSKMAKTSWESFSISLVLFFHATLVSSDDRLVSLNGIKYQANSSMNTAGSHLVFEDRTTQLPQKNLSQTVLQVGAQETQADFNKSNPGLAEDIEPDDKSITSDEEKAKDENMPTKGNTNYVMDSHGDDVSDGDDDNGDDVPIKDDAEYNVMGSQKDDVSDEDTNDSVDDEPVKDDDKVYVMESQGDDVSDNDGADDNDDKVPIKDDTEYHVMGSQEDDVSDDDGAGDNDDDEPVKDDTEYYVLKSQEDDVNDVGGDVFGKDDEDGRDEDGEYDVFENSPNDNGDDEGQGDDRYGDDDDDDNGKDRTDGNDEADEFQDENDRHQPDFQWADDEADAQSVLSVKEVHQNNSAMLSVYAWIALVGFITMAGFLVVLRGRHLLSKLLGGRHRYHNYRREDEKPLMA